jgi:hypothetical protein
VLVVYYMWLGGVHGAVSERGLAEFDATKWRGRVVED